MLLHLGIILEVRLGDLVVTLSISKLVNGDVTSIAATAGSLDHQVDWLEHVLLVLVDKSSLVVADVDHLLGLLRLVELRRVDALRVEEAEWLSVGAPVRIRSCLRYGASFGRL